MKQALYGILLLVAAGFMVNKLYNYYDTSNKNDRAMVNNEIVNIINKLQDSIRGSEVLFEQFIDLSELSESQQRGTWALLELIEADIDFSEEIQEAKDKLAAIEVSDSPSLLAMKESGIALIDSYKAYAPAYQNIIAGIGTKELSGVEIENLIATEMNKVSMATSTAAEAVRVAQEKFLRGD